jgi:hypothetical protein
LFCIVLRMCKEKSIVVHFIITSNGRALGLIEMLTNMTVSAMWMGR